MKINKAKLLVGTLAIASVAATVGSISGTVAWFQYSTRVTAAYSGAAAHVSDNLQIRLHREAANLAAEDAGYNVAADAGWSADLTRAMINDYIANVRGANTDHNLRPVTSGNALANGGIATSFYSTPVYQKSGAYTSNWGNASEKSDYIVLPMQLRVLSDNGTATSFPEGKKIYLTDLTVEGVESATKKDISNALRVSFDATNDATFSVQGEDVDTHGYLDLNGDGEDDLVEGYEWQTNRGKFSYGGDAAIEKTTKIEVAQDENGLIADDTSASDFIGKELGETAATGIFDVTVRIYLEGWQKLEDAELAAIKAAVVDKSEAYPTLAEMNAAALPEQGEPTFVPENGKVYKTADGKTYKWTAGEAPAAGAFSEVTIEDPMQAIWSSESYSGAEFNIGMRFATPVEA